MEKHSSPWSFSASTDFLLQSAEPGMAGDAPYTLNPRPSDQSPGKPLGLQSPDVHLKPRHEEGQPLVENQFHSNTWETQNQQPNW